jgi:hypothetical protein
MRDARWNRFGGVAGVLFVLVAVAAAALTGSPPKPEVSAIVFKDFFIDKQDLLVTQAWMYALCAPLLLWFAVAVRRILHEADEVGYLGDLFLVGTTAIAALLVVAMAMQIAIAKAADSLGAETVRAVGVDFGVVVVGLWGFIVAVTGFAYAACVMAYGVLPRWTAWLAVAAVVLNLVGTVGVFISSGPFSMEGGFTVWVPMLATILWYLGTSIAILRTRGLTGTSGD